MPSESETVNPQNIRVFTRDDWKCVYCGYDGKGEERWLFLVADHLDPAMKAKNDFAPEDDDNKVTSCIYCNQKKGQYAPKGTTRAEKLADASACVQSRREPMVTWFQQNYGRGKSLN